MISFDEPHLSNNFFSCFEGCRFELNKALKIYLMPRPKFGGWGPDEILPKAMFDLFLSLPLTVVIIKNANMGQHVCVCVCVCVCGGELKKTNKKVPISIGEF